MRNWCDLESVHANLRVVDFELAEAAVDDVLDAVEGERSLSDVGGDDALAELCCLEDLGLHLGRELRVDWHDDQRLA